MNFIFDLFKNLKPYKALSSALNTPCAVGATGLSGVHKASVIFSLCKEKSLKAFCICADEREANTLCDDLNAMGMKVLFYPYRDFTFQNVSGVSHDDERKRLGVLMSLLSEECDGVITCPDAAAQYTIPPCALADATLNIRVGKAISTDACTKALTLLGYERCDALEGEGQFALRGGILDFFPPGFENPVRAEFWGDEIDSLSYFDIITQRRTESVEHVTLCPSSEVIISDREELAKKIEKKASYLRAESSKKAKEVLYLEADALRQGLYLSNKDKFIHLVYEKTATLFDYIDDSFISFISEHTAVKDRVAGTEFRFSEDMPEYFAEGTLCRGFDSYFISWQDSIEKLKESTTVYLDNFPHGSYELPLKALENFSLRLLPPFSGQVATLVSDLESSGSENYATVLLCSTKKAAENITELLKEQGKKAILWTMGDTLTKGYIHVSEGILSGGFEISEESFMLFTQSTTQVKLQKKHKLPKDGQAIYSLSELSVGDYVVHTIHGVGIFGGITKLDSHGIVKDYIKISYAKGDVLYVPVTQLDLVAKYIGPKENSAVKLNRLGSGDFQKTKARVKKAVKDMAKELIALYTKRMQAQGHAFSSDTEWQRDFEARFEYEETPDQLRCSDEIKGDMERTAPMDRLLCGDVGFGKTEVALRAAFKCVSDSKQCALLCPTTILAWQHFQTISKRFEGYPIRIQLLSRFRSKEQQTEILKQLKRGEIDLVVGTHRLVQKDVEFRDLGLVIIDEEQRFGVAQKERLKEAYPNVDVLTLSATPIPRTLNMAMSGIRDMSVLEEAPQNRYPVQTYVLEHEQAIINEAIRRELRRGGQVFYLHNNVESIEAKAARLSSQIPEASIGVGHGKMSEQQLSKVWGDMLEQKIDVLVCTTIIETGVDISNANTLIIENADRFGLSQLHQLRGRIGRSNRRAYAYLTFTKAKVLSEISQKRLTAIREFTEFGSGFKIAMRDLELRGAGNILGAQQHGHMEDVGYDMYLKLLGDAVKEEKGELPTTREDKDCLVDISLAAHIPESYIESLTLRLDVYKLIADINTKEDATDVIDELIDRFGDVPKSVMGLIEIALIRNKAADMGIYEIKQNDTSVLLYVKDIKSPEIINLICEQKGNALLSAGSKPYVAVKLKSKTDPLSALRGVFKTGLF
ncbi:MAG: transcription-repair coupling factor [Clostridia bacterium]|nr:transcription-repair coupling factor [Clostridia bacterium]